MALSGPGGTPYGGHAGSVLSVAFHPRGDLLASADDDATVRLWDVATGDQRTTLTGHTGNVWSVAFHPGGDLLASAGTDGTVRLWDVATGEQRTTPAGHTGNVWSVAFHPGGDLLASAGDRTIRIWDPRNGKQVDGTGFGTPRRSGRPLAGVHPDSPSAEDLLNVTVDVETLADVIAATETRPPLAIALIGDWGAGKSSVMLQIQHRVEVLAEMSRNNPGLSDFAENVRQVRFNAWHYSDEHVWAGLVDHLFHTLAAPEPQASSADDLADPPTAETIQRELDARRADQRRLGNVLRAADPDPQASRLFGVARLPFLRLADPHRGGR